ncbi:hypothetical protein D3C78_1277930 [compost metagenome]
MHDRLEAEPGAHDADGQAEVAGGADRDPVLAEEPARLVAVQGFVAVAAADQPGTQGQVFGVLEHLVDAAASLDRAGDGQLVVGLEPQRAAVRQAGFLQQQTLQLVQGHDCRFDDPARGRGFREDPGEVWGKALQPGAGLCDVLRAQADVRQARGGGRDSRVEPGGFPERHQIRDQRVAGEPGIECLAVNHARSSGQSVGHAPGRNDEGRYPQQDTGPRVCRGAGSDYGATPLPRLGLFELPGQPEQ